MSSTSHSLAPKSPRLEGVSVPVDWSVVATVVQAVLRSSRMLSARLTEPTRHAMSRACPTAADVRHQTPRNAAAAGQVMSRFIVYAGADDRRARTPTAAARRSRRRSRAGATPLSTSRLPGCTGSPACAPSGVYGHACLTPGIASRMFSSTTRKMMPTTTATIWLRTSAPMPRPTMPNRARTPNVAEDRVLDLAVAEVARRCPWPTATGMPTASCGDQGGDRVADADERVGDHLGGDDRPARRRLQHRRGDRLVAELGGHAEDAEDEHHDVARRRAKTANRSGTSPALRTPSCGAIWATDEQRADGDRGQQQPEPDLGGAQLQELAADQPDHRGPPWAGGRVRRRRVTRVRGSRAGAWSGRAGAGGRRSRSGRRTAPPGRSAGRCSSCSSTPAAKARCPTWAASTGRAIRRPVASSGLHLDRLPGQRLRAGPAGSACGRPPIRCRPSAPRSSPTGRAARGSGSPPGRRSPAPR